MHIGIVGAGIVGRLLALELLEQGNHVVLYDKTHANDATTASHVAAGMLSPYSEMESGNMEIAELGVDAIARWQSILPKLLTRPTLHAEGSILLANPQDQAEIEHFFLRCKRHKIPCSIIGKKEILLLEPGLPEKDFIGIYLKNEGYLNAGEVMNSLAQTLHAKKITWHEKTPVLSIQKNNVSTAQNTIQFDHVFDCRGLGTTLENLRAVRGELIQLYAPDVHIHRPVRLLHPRYALYLVPRPDHQYIIGATSIESKDYSPISVQSTLELLSASCSIHPGFSEARIIRTATQCRPAFNTNIPMVLKTPDCIHINGMYRHGFLLAPKMVSEAMQYISGVTHEYFY